MNHADIINTVECKTAKILDRPRHRWGWNEYAVGCLYLVPIAAFLAGVGLAAVLSYLFFKL